MSKRFSLDMTDIQSIAKGAGVAALGGVLAWASTTFIPSLGGSGSTTGILLAGVLAVAVNAIRKWLAGEVN